MYGIRTDKGSICFSSYLYNCNSLFTRLLSHHVFVFTHMLSVHFSAFFMHYPRYKTLAVRMRNCLLQRHFRDVALRPARITDIRLSRMTCAGSHLLSCNRHSAAIFCPVIGTRSGQRRWKRSKSQKFWVHTYPTVSSGPKGRCVQSLVKIGSEIWICITYKQTNFQLCI